MYVMFCANFVGSIVDVDTQQVLVGDYRYRHALGWFATFISATLVLKTEEDTNPWRALIFASIIYAIILLHATQNNVVKAVNFSIGALLTILHTFEAKPTNGVVLSKVTTMLTVIILTINAICVVGGNNQIISKLRQSIK